MDINKINWDFVSICLDFINILIIVIPAISIYMYYKFNIVDIHVFEESEGGIIFGIHNITSKTVYLTNCVLKIKTKNATQIIKFDSIENDKYFIISPDQIKKIKLDFTILKIESCSEITIVLNHKHKKIYKRLKRGNKFVFR